MSTNRLADLEPGTVAILRDEVVVVDGPHPGAEGWIAYRRVIRSRRTVSTQTYALPGEVDAVAHPNPAAVLDAQVTA
jgi:hypothetical protein